LVHDDGLHGPWPKERLGEDAPDVVTLYEHAPATPDSQTPKLLELYARVSELLTPEEIGVELGRARAHALPKGSARAVVRNLSRMQGHLVKTGRISREVLVKDSSRYREEGATRFGLSPDARAELRSHLGVYQLPA
jgi:hypothetical protein